MNEHLQHAMASMAAVTERAGHLTRDEQETLAVRLDTFAERLHWEQWFHLPESFLADQAMADAPKVAAASIQPPSHHCGPPAVSTRGTASTRTPFMRAASGSPSTARGGDAPDVTPSRLARTGRR
jgi:hypothetical protein